MLHVLLTRAHIASQHREYVAEVARGFAVVQLVVRRCHEAQLSQARVLSRWRVQEIQPPRVSATEDAERTSRRACQVHDDQQRYDQLEERIDHACIERVLWLGVRVLVMHGVRPTDDCVPQPRVR